MDGRLSSIAVASDLGGSLNIVGANSAGAVWHRYQTGQNPEQWSSWSQIAGATMTHVAIAKESFGSGGLDLLGINAKGQISLNSTSGLHGTGGWRGWQPVPDTAAVGPSASPASDRSTDLGSAVDVMLSATGGTAPYSMSFAGLPNGLVATGGFVTGTPTAAGTFTVTVTTTDTVHESGTQSFLWTIHGITVPDVLSESRADAEQAIQSAGLTVGTESALNNCVDAGSVHNQSPGGGAVVPPGSAVNLTISSCTTNGGGGDGGPTLPK
jgi:hypothetical protein